MKTLFTFLLILLLITGIGGCYKCVKNDYYVDIDQMQVAAQLSNYGNTLQESFPIRYDSLVIMTYFSGTWYTHAKNNSQFSFLPSAIARDDCDPGMKGSKETIESINIIALNEFDNEFKANDTINSIVNVYSTWATDEQPKSIQQFMAEIQPGIRVTDYGGPFFKLIRKPTQNVIKLRVDISFTNGEKYSAETIPITIKQ